MNGKERVEKLGRLLKERIPDIGIDVDAPSRPAGDWFVDIEQDDRFFVIQLRPAAGFGLSPAGEGFGEGPEEFIEDEASVVERVAEKLRASSST